MASFSLDIVFLDEFCNLLVCSIVVTDDGTVLVSGSRTGLCSAFYPPPPRAFSQLRCSPEQVSSSLDVPSLGVRVDFESKSFRAQPRGRNTKK